MPPCGVPSVNTRCTRPSAWCARSHARTANPPRLGVVLDTGNPRYLAFYQRQGYEEIGEVAVGPVREHVFFHANPQVLHSATG